MSNVDYNPYRTFIDSIEHEATSSSRTREFVLLGARGLGKSTVAQALFARLTGDDEQPIIAGRSPGKAIAALEDAIGADASVIVVDDADYLLEDREVQAQERLATLLNSINWQNPQRPIIVLTAENNGRLQAAVEFNDTCSAFIQRAVPWPLEPWLRDWRREIRRSVIDALRVTDSSTSDGGSSRDEDLVEAWSTTIEVQTGGHPTLVARALTVLHGLVAQKVEDLPRREELVEQYLAPLIEPSVGPLVEKALKYYRRRRPADYARLIEAAAAPSDAGLIPVSAAQTGLAYSTTTTTGLTLVGGLVKQTLKALGESAPAVTPSAFLPAIIGATRTGKSTLLSSVLADIRTVPDDQVTRGTLVAMRDGHEVKVELTGSLWRIIDRLQKADGVVVPAETLVEEVKLGTMDALRSAVQRLRAALEKAQLDRALQNVRGVGYKWDLKALPPPASPTTSR